MKIRNYEILEIHASYCRVLANPKRLAIMACLEVKEMGVSEIADATGFPLPTVSRHLGMLKGKHLVISRHEGTRVFYRPADLRIMEACRLIRTVLIDGLKKHGEIAQEVDPNDIVIEDTVQ